MNWKLMSAGIGALMLTSIAGSTLANAEPAARPTLLQKVGYDDDGPRWWWWRHHHRHWDDDDYGHRRWWWRHFRDRDHYDNRRWDDHDGRRDRDDRRWR
jgi:hypothetical protein